MKKICLLIFALWLTPIASASTRTHTENWCGTYFEYKGKAYFRLPVADINEGSQDCNIEDYNRKIKESGFINVELDFTKSRSKLNQWQKFNAHLIEIRGKLNKNEIINSKLIRDIGA